MNIQEIRDIDTGLGKLADLCGIEYQSESEVKVNMLKAMDVLDDSFDYYATDPEVREKNLNLICKLIRNKMDANFINIVHHVPVLRQNRVDTIEVSLPDGVQNLKWDFYEDENPKKYYAGMVEFDDSAKVYSGQIAIKDLEPCWENNRDNAHTINGVVYRKYRFKFPFDVRLGYHNAVFSYVDCNGVEHAQRTHLISAPERCYDGLGIKEGHKTWGVPVQLYEQVSENNLGIGNYSDLAQLGYILGKNGAGVMGVNPLHASRDDLPENASPYSPDCRMFFNYIYLDVTAIEEFKNYPEIREYYESEAIQKKIEKNRRKAYVDYTATQELVDDILMRCYKKFQLTPDSEDHNLFEVFCDSQDGILDMYAVFHALSRHFANQNPRPLNWTYWPEEFKNPNSPAVRRFMEEHKDEVGFYKYAQYQCSKQIAEVKETCLNAGMKIGLYTDMAVGVSTKGFEAWYYPDLFIKGSAGAAPDELSPIGQVWNLLGFNPIKLQEQGYEPYRRILEANMKYAGCMRIDHVLQLNRLYFKPKDGEKGTFIYYNSEELMALVALESHRHKTMIIGEDIGATTDEFRRRMEDYGILSYKVLPFERENDVFHSMRRPENYPQYSVCATSTHDTPTLVNQWNVQHVWLMKKLGFYDEKVTDGIFEQFASQREALNWVLDYYGCWQAVGGCKCEHPREDANYVPEKYVPAVAYYMAQANSAIMMMPFSDIFGTSEMGNIPGVSEMSAYSANNSDGKNSLMDIQGSNERIYHNWRQKMHIWIEIIEQIDSFRENVSILNKYRPDGNDGKGQYYQFERLGNNFPSTIDFAKARRLYNILRYRDEYTLSQLLKHRYSDAFKNRIERRANDVVKCNQKAVNDYLEFMRQKKLG